MENNKNDGLAQLLKVGQQLLQQYQDSQKAKPQSEPGVKVLGLTASEAESLRTLVLKGSHSILVLTPDDKAVIDKVMKL